MILTKALLYFFVDLFCVCVPFWSIVMFPQKIVVPRYIFIHCNFFVFRIVVKKLVHVKIRFRLGALPLSDS